VISPVPELGNDDALPVSPIGDTTSEASGGLQAVPEAAIPRTNPHREPAAFNGRRGLGEENTYRVSIVSSRRVRSQELTKEEIIKAKNTIIRSQEKRINWLQRRYSTLERRMQQSRRLALTVTEALAVAIDVQSDAPMSSG
jgi:hypothetical protein